MKGIILVFLLFVGFVFGATELSEMDRILKSCKYIRCKNVIDLNRESRIRQCIKINCNSRAFRVSKLTKFCWNTCIEETKDLTQEKLEKQKGDLPTVMDYSWLE